MHTPAMMPRLSKSYPVCRSSFCQSSSAFASADLRNLITSRTVDQGSLVAYSACIEASKLGVRFTPKVSINNDQVTIDLGETCIFGFLGTAPRRIACPTCDVCRVQCW